MPKRTSEQKIEHYRRKIKKLEQKQPKNQYRRIIYSSDDSNNSDTENLDAAPADSEPICMGDQGLIIDNTEENKTNSDQDPVPELDPEILSALGETTEETSKFGPKIHESLSRLWSPILRKGLNKEVKEKLVKEYLVPENLPLLQAPKLNPEVSSAMNEGARTRDKRVEAVQQQLGHGIAALSKGLELLLDDGKERVKAIKFLSDSCRLLCDLHHTETVARQKFVTPGLDKSFLSIMQDVDRDEMLFGNKLSEKIKASKVIEKHGLQIKKPSPNVKNSSTSYQPSSSRTRQQGNWSGPPRFSSHRGGRGGLKKATLTGRRAPLAGSNAQSRQQASQSKQRVPGQQQ